MKKELNHWQIISQMAIRINHLEKAKNMFKKAFKYRLSETKDLSAEIDRLDLELKAVLCQHEQDGRIMDGLNAKIRQRDATIKEREAEAKSYRKLYNELKEVIICDEELKYDRGDIAYTVTTTSGTWSHKEALKYIRNLKNKAIEEYINRTDNKYEKLKEENSALKEMLFKEKAKASARNAEKLKLLKLCQEWVNTTDVLGDFRKWQKERAKKRGE
jgi:hypothetical protein